MNNNTLAVLNAAQTANISELPLSSELKLHRKAITRIAFTEGIDGVKRYKLQHPAASSIQVHMKALAYSVKPVGYDAYILKLSAKWLTGDPSLAKSNIAEVHELNENFATDRFNPTNHFSKPLSRSLLGKLATRLGEQGVKLDTVKDNTLSKVKAVACAARAYRSSDRKLGSAGVICGDKLIVSGVSHTIGIRGGRECIRVNVNSDRIWLRLDVLEAAWDLISRSTAGYPPNTPPLELGELVPTSQIDKIDPLLLIEMGERSNSTGSSVGEFPYSTGASVEELPNSTISAIPEGPTACPSPPRTLAERIAALVASRDSEPNTCAQSDEIDPLSLLPFD